MLSSSRVIGLKDVFGNTSDPRYFVEFETQARTLQLLSGPVEEALNIRLLVGEPGVGKTALLLRLLQQVDSTVLTTRLFWTQLRRNEFVHYFLHELGVRWPLTSLAEAQKQLTSVLERNFSCGRQVMVVIDEAHELRISTLRAVAELLDCPLGRSGQLRIILAGLPVLKVKTASPLLAEFSKRISSIASLGPLTFEESCWYIKHKIELSEFREDQCFTHEAIALISKLTGMPRDINNLCFAAIYRAEQRGCRLIDEDLVLEVAAEEGTISARSRDQEVSSTEARTARSSSQGHAAGSTWAGISLGETSEQFNSRHGAECSFHAAAVCTASPDDLSTCISAWFGDERLAWAGTTGELATSLQQPEDELMEVLNSSSDALRSRGIQLDVVESYGHTSSVRFRALESRRKARTDTAAEGMLTQRERDLPGDGKAAGSLIDNDVPQSEAALQVVSGAPSDFFETNGGQPSAFEPAPNNLLPAQSEQVFDAYNSLWRKALLPVLLSIFAVVLALAMAHVLRARYAHSPQQFIPQASLPGSRAAVTASRTNVPVNAAGEASRVTKTSPEPSSQLLRAARSGDANAQLELGTAYATGHRVPVDPLTAYTWLTLAFANGNKRAEHVISELTPTLSSAEIGRIRWKIAGMYADGIGVPPDKVTAYMWHLLAEFSGETRSRTARKRLALTMTDGQKAEAQPRASEWLRRHHQALKTPSLPQS